MRNSFSSSLLLLALLMGCQSALTPSSVALPTPLPSPTAAHPGELAPTATQTATTLPEPTPTFPPEIVATKPEEVAGVWRVKTFVGQGGLVKFPADLTFREDGTFSFDEIGDDPMHIFGGTLQFADGLVTLDSQECYNEAKAFFYHCTIIFTIFSTLQAGKPVRIRLVSDQNTGVFVVNVRGKYLMPSVP